MNEAFVAEPLSLSKRPEEKRRLYRHAVNKKHQISRKKLLIHDNVNNPTILRGMYVWYGRTKTSLLTNIVCFLPARKPREKLQWLQWMRSSQTSMDNPKISYAKNAL